MGQSVQNLYDIPSAKGFSSKKRNGVMNMLKGDSSVGTLTQLTMNSNSKCDLTSSHKDISEKEKMSEKINALNVSH